MDGLVLGETPGVGQYMSGGLVALGIVLARKVPGRPIAAGRSSDPIHVETRNAIQTLDAHRTLPTRVVGVKRFTKGGRM
jgi:hypothetical protein